MTATTMKRSTKEALYVTPYDFSLALRGVKTATSRLGDRRELWPVGSELDLVDNENGAGLRIRIVYNEVMELGDINDTHAGTIGGYDTPRHWDDFTSIYEGSGGSTVISLVGFLVIS